ncbi:MAG: efflux RND transporter periplasmic adaptor subunit, partial [bacterium]
AVAPTNHASLGGSLAVRAPISGTIIEKHAVSGELVEPGKDVMILADLSTAWIWGGIYDRDLAAVLSRMAAGVIPVEVTVPAFPGRVFTGRLNYVAGVMDEATRTVKVRTVIANDERLLRPGMFCEVRLLLTTDEDVVAIPKAALLSDEGVDFVFRHMKDDYFLRQNVKKGRAFDNSIEILEGLEPGQTIVAEGAFVLKSDVLRSKMGAGCAD